MAIISAAIEANGWVLAVRGDWAATAGAWEFDGDDRVQGRFLSGGIDQFPLDADGAPKIVLEVRSAGFDRVGGEAVPNMARARRVVAVKALRRPWPDHAQLDETAHGDGTGTVRLALSDRIYGGCVVISAAFLAGWKAGEGAAQPEVANGSARALPVAISRWAQPSFELVTGTSSYAVEVIAAAHHPEHHGAELHQALAGMRVTATDGTRVVSAWAAVGDSTRGDGLRCWRAVLDLSPLTAGPVTIHRTDYPWIGSARSTGTAHSTDATNGLPTPWASPHCISYDPAGTLYPRRHVVVNAATGTTVVANVTVATSLAAAKVGVAAADVITAIAALRAANLALPARNGWAADTAYAMDWHVVTAAAGVHPFGTGSVASGANCNEGRLMIRGDPDDADPRANCVVQTGATAPTRVVNRLWLENLTVEQGVATFGSGGMWHFENVEVRGRAGYETGNGTTAFSGSSPAGYANLSFCRSLWWKFDVSLEGSNRRALLMRCTGTSRAADAVVHIGGWKAVDPFFPSRDTSSAAAFGTWSVASVPASDAMLWGCTAMDWAGRFLSADGARSGGSGTEASPVTYTRLAVVNCLCERSRGNSGERIWSIGEGSYDQLQDSIFEGNTLHGNGFNGFYAGGPSGNANLLHVGNVHRNNVFGRHAIKQDIFKKNGALTGAWEALYGVGFAGNVHGNQASTENSNFQFAWMGLRAAVNGDFDSTYGRNAFLRFVADRSDYGPDAPAGMGNGDYRPAAGSPLLGRGAVASIDRFAAGAVRGDAFAAGAEVAAWEPAVAVAADGGAMGMWDVPPLLRAWALLLGGDDVLAMRAAPAGVRMAMAARGRAVGLRMMVVEPDARMLRVAPE